MLSLTHYRSTEGMEASGWLHHPDASNNNNDSESKKALLTCNQ
jgi:hypothetical protein